jgi:carbon monoxide dehydrogenase subunit G
MIQIESKTAVVDAKPEQVFDYLTDFTHFDSLLPKESLSDVELSKEKILFSLQGLGRVGLAIREKIPPQEIRIGSTAESSADFTLVLRITPLAEGQSAIRINLKANLNMFLEMVARSPLQQFADLMADKLEQINFSDQEG